ncbi:MAG: carboxypeptidase-like regulatory domain-containing protein, partial [Candidatus Andersenbacteria bacterium]
LHIWQTMQHLGRVLSWPIFLAGALLNTVLVFMAPRPLYLVIEITYIALVIIKIALEVRIRPAYGQVRDAITHVPLDLAVVRLFEQGTNRLIMTRVTNNQGKFFALPPAGTYTVTISKAGYATFSKQDVELTSEHDTTLQLTADLMPVAPPGGGLAQARASVL